MNNDRGDGLLKISNLKVWFPIDKGIWHRDAEFVRAVDGVDLSLAAGRTLALVGESGSGKTTVGLSIARLVKAREGKVWFDGVELLSLPSREFRAYRRRLQVVFQDTVTALDPGLNIRNIIAEGMNSFDIGGNPEERAARVAELLRMVGLDQGIMKRYPSELSGGQRQRVGIARALAVEPELIICDEAVSALDMSVQAQILNLLQDLQERLSLAYLFITHDLSVVQHFAHEVAVMYLGQIVEKGSVEQVFSDPRHPYTRALLAAIPSTRPGERTVIVRARGEIPSPINPPGGCRFHPRCPEAFARCREEFPPLYETEGGLSRCFLSESTAKRNGLLVD